MYLYVPHMHKALYKKFFQKKIYIGVYVETFIKVHKRQISK